MMAIDRPKRVGCQLCYPFEEKRLAKWLPPYFVQPKLDGERCRAIVTGPRVLLLSSTEEIITSVPHLNAHLANLPDGEYDGELYVHGWTFEEIHSVVSRSVNLHNVYDEMQFHVFDLVTSEPFMSRLITLMALYVENAPNVVKVETLMAHDFEDIMKARERFVSEGYEGIIIRHSDFPYERKRSTGVMKFKPKKRDAYQIIDAFEEIDKHGTPKGRLGGFVCLGDDGTQFCVGSGFNYEQRDAYWKNRDKIIGRFLMVEYQALTPGRGCPRFPIFCEIISRESAAEIEFQRSL